MLTFISNIHMRAMSHRAPKLHDDVINGNISALLALWLCEGNSPVTGEFTPQRPVMRSFGVFFDLRLIKRLSKQSKRWWFETASRSLWRHCNENLCHAFESYDIKIIAKSHRIQWVKLINPGLVVSSFVQVGCIFPAYVIVMHTTELDTYQSLERACQETFN